MYNKIKSLKEKIIGAQILFKRISKEKRILGIFIILLIGFLLYQSLIAVQMLRLKAISFQFISQKKLIDFYNRLITQTDVLISEVKEKKTNILKIKERFIDEEELSDYFNNFRALVKSHNLEVLGLDFKPQETITDLNIKPLSYYQRLRFNVSVKGGYFNTMQLLHKLEQDSQIFDIESIHIRQGGRDSGVVIMDMEAAIYILMKRI